MRMYVLARIVVGRGTSKDSNANHRKSSQRPDERTLVEVRQNVVHQRVDGETSSVVGDVNQELVPALGLVCLKDIRCDVPPRGVRRTGFIREITPRTSWLPSNPPVATRATQPEQFTQPVIQDRTGIHRSQETDMISIESHIRTHIYSLTATQWYWPPALSMSVKLELLRILDNLRGVSRKKLSKRSCHAQIANTSRHQTW